MEMNHYIKIHFSLTGNYRHIVLNCSEVYSHNKGTCFDLKCKNPFPQQQPFSIHLVMFCAGLRMMRWKERKIRFMEIYVQMEEVGLAHKYSNPVHVCYLELIIMLLCIIIAIYLIPVNSVQDLLKCLRRCAMNKCLMQTQQSRDSRYGFN